MHKRDIFGRRIAKGLSPFLCHVILWSGVALNVWIEVYAAMRSLSIDSGRHEAISVDVEKPDPNNDGRVVHITGKLESAAPAGDRIFGPIPGSHAAFIRRTVEMRQWKKSPPRRPSKEGFELVWAKEEIDTRSDGAPKGFQNEPMAIRDETAIASGLLLGGFELDEGVIAAIDRLLDVPPTRELASKLEIAMPGQQAFLSREWIVLNDGQPQISRYRITDDRVWPAGALRVKFSILPLGPFTISGTQSGNRIRAFASSGGASMLIALTGIHSREALFHSADSSNRFMYWAIRILASIVIFVGLHLLTVARDRLRKYGPDYFPNDWD